MGFIINCYMLPKEDIKNFESISDNEYEVLSDNNKLPEDIYERVLYNFTSWIHFDGFPSDNEDKVWSELFRNKLNILDDLTYKTINKEQFRNIIHLVCSQVKKNFKSMTIDLDDLKIFNDFKTKPIDLSKLEKKYPACMGSENKDLTLIEKMCSNVFDTYQRYMIFNICYGNDESLDEILNSKWSVNAMDFYDYILAELIFIYKIFDWKHNVLLAVGG